MPPAPDPEMQRDAGRMGIPTSQKMSEESGGALDFQARKLRRLFLFCHSMACTIARLAYGVAR
jgi:hypothetical protein